MTFAYAGLSQDNVNSNVDPTNLRTLAVAIGVAVGDIVFLVVKGNTAARPQFTFTPTGSWTQLGSPVVVSYVVTPPGITRAARLQIWYQVATTTTVSTTVTGLTPGSTGTFTWQVALIPYTPTPSGQVPNIAAPCVDESTGAVTSFTPTPLVTPDATVITFACQQDLQGTPGLSPAQSFTPRATLTPFPMGRWADRVVTAGTITMPTFTSGSAQRWMGKSFSLTDRRGGIYLGEAVHL